MKTVVEIRVRNKEITFDEAKTLAEAVAAIYSDEVMILAWYDEKSNRFFPQVACCDCGDGRPSWEIYADSRGAKIKVIVNDGEYVFLFL